MKGNPCAYVVSLTRKVRWIRKSRKRETSTATLLCVEWFSFSLIDGLRHIYTMVMTLSNSNSFLNFVTSIEYLLTVLTVFIHNLCRRRPVMLRKHSIFHEFIPFDGLELICRESPNWNLNRCKKNLSTIHSLSWTSEGKEKQTVMETAKNNHQEQEEILLRHAHIIIES